jgi:hypothetical protein
MSKPIVRIHNTDTNEIIDREMTNAEFAQYQKDQAEAKAFKVEIEAKAQAKQALFDRLGITEDEAKLLLS